MQIDTHSYNETDIHTRNKQLRQRRKQALTSIEDAFTAARTTQIDTQVDNNVLIHDTH